MSTRQNLGFRLIEQRRRRAAVASALAAWTAKRDQHASQLVHIVSLGDSITEGTAASNTDSLAFVPLERAQLQASYSGGGKGLWPMRSQIISRYTASGAGWAGGTAGPGSFSRKAAGSANFITATVTGDRLYIGYNETPTSGDFTYTVDGGAPVTVTVPTNATVTPRLYQASLGTNGAHTVVVKCSDVPSRDTELWAIGASVGSTGIQFHEFGFSGQTSGIFTQAADSLLWLNALAPALVVCCLDTNDYAAQTSLATYQANLTTIITAAQAAGASVLFLTAPNRAASLTITQQQYRDVIASLCATYNCKLVDTFPTWGDATQAVGMGLVEGDGVHPKDAGHRNMQELLNPVLTPLLPGPFQDDMGFDFRATAGYVADPASCYFTPATEVYPFTKAGTGNKTGWYTTQGATVSVADRSAAVDARLAGIGFVSHAAAGQKLYKREVTPGTYTIRLAGGDAAAANTDFYCQIRDGATVLATISHAGVPGGQFVDATGVVRTSAADWTANNAGLTGLVVAGTVLTFDFSNPGGMTGNNKIAHIRVTKTG